MKKLAATLLVLAAMTPLVAAVSCREPTQIMLDITTDVPCGDVASAGGIDVRVGSPASVDDAPTTRLSATTCSGGKIGTLAIVPSGADDQVAILVSVASKVPPVTRTQSTACSATAPENCVIARRVVRYVSHTALPLPIALLQSCAGIRCPSTQTCVEGVCADATLQCNERGCSPPPPVDAGPPDVAPKDAGIIDTGVDSGCNPQLLDTDPNNCGTCGFVCPSKACVGGMCKVVTIGPLSQLDGCLALTKNHVVWTGNETSTSHGYTAPKTGATALASNEPAAIGSAKNVSASLSSASYVAVTPPSIPTGYVVHVAPPAIGTGTVVPNLRWVSRNDDDVVCSLVGAQTICSDNSPAIGTQSATSLAKGKTTWAAIGGGLLTVGAGAANATVILPAGATNWITSRRGTDTYYYDLDKEVWSVVAQPPQGLSPVKLFAGAGGVIVGMVHDGLTDTLYWVEAVSAGQFAIFARSITAPPLRKVLSATKMNGLGPRVCIDVDDKAVYFLKDGIPFMVAK